MALILFLLPGSFAFPESTNLSPLGILKRFAIQHNDGRCMDVGGMEDLTGLRLTYSRFISETQYYNKRPRVEYVRKQMDLNGGLV